MRKPKVEGYLAVHDEGKEWLIAKAWSDDYFQVIARCRTEDEAKKLVRALTALIDGGVGA